MLTRQQYLDRWSALHGGYDPRASGPVQAWLILVYTLARPLVRMRVGPTAVTLAGGLLAAAALYPAWVGGSWAVAAAALVALSGISDSLDGAVAVLTQRTSRWGYVLDSLVDRVSDVAYLVLLATLGAPGWLCVAAGVLMGLHEYTRARAGNAGMGEIGVVTVAERPTRVIVTTVCVLGAGLHPGAAAAWATAGAGAWLVVGLVGLGQLLVHVHRRLSSGVPDEPGDDLG